MCDGLREREREPPLVGVSPVFIAYLWAMILGLSIAGPVKKAYHLPPKPAIVLEGSIVGLSLNHYNLLEYLFLYDKGPSLYMYYVC